MTDNVIPLLRWQHKNVFVKHKYPQQSKSWYKQNRGIYGFYAPFIDFTQIKDHECNVSTFNIKELIATVTW